MVLREKGYSTAVGDEGGFAPDLSSNREALEVIMEAIIRAGYKEGKDIAIALDPAASVLRKTGSRFSYTFHRRRISRRRLGWVEAIDRKAGRENSIGGR